MGDVILIETGKTVPADCVLIQSNDLSLSESVITGESEPVYKANVTQENYSSNPSPFIMQSTLVEQGDGRAIVCAVGEHTQALSQSLAARAAAMPHRDP